MSHDIEILSDFTENVLNSEKVHTMGWYYRSKWYYYK